MVPLTLAQQAIATDWVAAVDAVGLAVVNGRSADAPIRLGVPVDAGATPASDQAGSRAGGSARGVPFSLSRLAAPAADTTDPLRRGAYVVGVEAWLVEDQRRQLREEVVEELLGEPLELGADREPGTWPQRPLAG
jgi:hypothetical protein